MFLIALLAFLCDQLPKLFVLRALDLAAVNVIPVWAPYFNLLMAWNKGVNFGIAGQFDLRWVLIAFSVVVSIGLAWWVRDKKGWIFPLAAGLVAGGAFGNAIDRVVYGAVVDFLNVSCCGIRNPYAFNIADVLIVLGAALLVFGQGRSERAQVA